LELAWICELGESPPLLSVVGEKEPELRIGLEMGLERKVEPESDARGDRGPKPPVGGFFGLTFANLGICK
jgi:hypothetical protein